ncbi:MAG TPA: heparin lyase I family protein [Solirubrobacterales bacterium]
MRGSPRQAGISIAVAALFATALALLLLPATASAAAGPHGPGRFGKPGKAGGAHRGARARRAARRAHRRRAARRRQLAMRRRLQRRRNRSADLSDNVALTKQRGPRTPPEVVDAGFEEGLMNWNTAGVGQVVPEVVSDTVRSGAHSARVVLTGEQERSELILGGDGDGSYEETIQFGEGYEGWYAFSFYIDQMVYGHPGGHNLIFQFKGAPDNGSPNFGLQLWDYEGDDGVSGGRGLWSHGEAAGGDRFLGPVAEHEWHDVAIHFKISGQGDGFYETFLDGRLVDERSGVSIIGEGAETVYIKDGIYRNPETVSGTSEIRLDACKLGPTYQSVLPG